MSLSIGQLAREGGVGVETIRFYEREGLLAEPPRAPSGHRTYSGGEVARLRFIRRAKELGFTLAETRELLSLQAEPEADCSLVKHRTEEKLRDIDARIRTLTRMRRALRTLHAACEGERTPIPDCPLLAALEGDER